jgi:hypothetical protein
MSVSTALPCWLSIHDKGRKTILAFLRPTILLGMLDLPQLE